MVSLENIVKDINRDNGEFVLISQEMLDGAIIYLLNNNHLASFESNNIYGLNGIRIQHDEDWEEGIHRFDFFQNCSPCMYVNNEVVKSELILGEEAIYQFLLTHPIWHKSKPNYFSFFEASKTAVELIKYSNFKA